MDLKSTIDIILKDLKEARVIMDDLKRYPDVPEIQIELAKAKCRSAEEVLKFLTTKDLPSPEKNEINTSREAKEEDKEKIKTETATEEDTISDIENKDNVDVFEITDFEGENEQAVAGTAETEKQSNEAEIIDQIIQPENITEDVGKETESKQKGKIVADKFAQQSSINEQIAHKRHDNAEVSKLKPVNDLSSAIGINDRFLFVRELFNGNQDLYNNTINNLNEVASIDEAFDILTKTCKPEKDNTTFDLLLDLVKRKLRTK